MINRILVRGNQRIDQTTVLSYLPIQPGDTVDAAVLDVAVRTLTRTQLFADVQLGVQPNGDLIVEIVENPIINQVVFEGNGAISEDKLTEEVTLKPRGIYTRARVQEDVGKIVELYRLSGRISATVTPKLVQLEQNRVDVVFEIDEGPETGVRAITFLGNTAFSDSDLREVMVTKQIQLVAPVHVQRQLRSEPSGLRPRTAAEILHQPRLLRFPRPLGGRRTGAGRRRLRHHLTVDEGDRYNFGTVDVVTENDRLNPDFLKLLLPIRTGDLYESDKIETAVDALTFAAGSAGYAFVEIEPISRQSRDRHGRRHLQRQGRPARLRRPHQRRRQHPHAGQRHPPRDDADRGRRLQPHPAGAFAQQPARPGLLQGRDGRGSAAVRRPTVRSSTSPSRSSRPANSPSAPASARSTPSCVNLGITERNFRGRGQNVVRPLSSGARCVSRSTSASPSRNSSAATCAPASTPSTRATTSANIRRTTTARPAAACACRIR